MVEGKIGNRKVIALTMHSRLTFIVAAWSVLMLSSCKEVTFPVAQPKGVKALTELPVSIRGKYIIGDPKETTKDTLIVEAKGYHFKDSDEKDFLGKGVISDSLVIKFYKDYYFINFRSDDQWALRIVKQKPSGALDFMAMNLNDDNRTEEELIAKLSKQLDVKKLETEDGTFYQINPTPNQLMSLIKDGYFSSITLEKK